MKYFKTFVVFAVLLATLFASKTSDAGDDGIYYFKGEIGYGFPNDPGQVTGAGSILEDESNDDFYKYGIGFGINPEGPVRMDFSFSYSPNLDSTANHPNNLAIENDVDNYLYMINAYYDFDEMGQGFVPYISGGIGSSRMVPEDTRVQNASGTFNIREGGKTKNNFGWALGLGTAIQTDGNLTIDMGYRYVAMGEREGNGENSGTPALSSDSGTRVDHLFVHELYLGLRVGF